MPLLLYLSFWPSSGLLPFKNVDESEYIAAVLLCRQCEAQKKPKNGGLRAARTLRSPESRDFRGERAERRTRDERPSGRNLLPVDYQNVRGAADHR